MQLNEFLEVKENLRNGSFLVVEYTSESGFNAKAKKEGFSKVVKAVLRIGIEYSNTNYVKENEIEVQPLKWGHWLNEQYKFIIEHKGEYYVRFYQSEIKNKVTYLKNGKEVEKPSNDYFLKSSNEKNDSKVVTIKLKNINSITQNHNS